MDLLRFKQKLLPLGNPQDSGGGGSTQTSIQDLPDWAKGTAKNVLGAAESTVFQKDPSGKITGFQPYQQYGGERTAQFTPLQQQAYGNAYGMDAGPQGFAQNIGTYMSPYQQNVIDREKMEAARASQLLGQQQQAQATQAGAFGGYREGIQRAERERGLRSQMQDIQTRGSQAAYDRAADQFRQGINQQMAVGQQQAQFGTQQQGQIQKALDTAYQDFVNQQKFPMQQIGYLSDILRGTPMGGTSTIYSPGPSMAQTLGSLGMGAYGLSKLGLFAEGGSVTSDQNVEGILDNLSVEQLKQSRQIAVANGDRARVEMIDDELAQRASEARGMSAAFNQLPAESQGAMFEAANGGVVAFADRGLVKAPEFTLPDYKKMYDEASRLSGELPNTMYKAPTQEETAAGIRAQRGLVQEMMGPDKMAPFLEELATKRRELKDSGGQAKGLAALAAAGEMLQGRGLGSIGKGISKFGSEVGRLTKEKEEADRLLLASQVQLASAQQARADGQFDKATTLYKSAEDLRVKALDAKRDVLGKQASLQATMAGQGLSAATNKFTAELNAETSRANTAEQAASRRAIEERNQYEKKFQKYQVASDQLRRVDEAIAREKNNPEYQQVLKDASMRADDGTVPEALKTRVEAAKARITQAEANWELRRQEAERNLEMARRRIEGEAGPAGPSTTATRTSGSAALPEGIPAGSKPIGKDRATGRTVYQTPDGRKLIQD
jgi:hypothetical protein